MKRCSLVAPVLIAMIVSVAASPAYATTAAVPDSFPTVQAGIDSGRDTVLVRGGRYDENLVANRALALLAYPPADSYDRTELPLVGGLAVARVPNSGLSLLVRGFRFLGKVRVTSNPGVFSATFEICRLDSGLSVPGDPADVMTLNVSGCTVQGGMAVNAMAVNILLNSVYGGGINVYGEGYYTIRGNYIHGPAPFGIQSQDGGGSSSIEGNTVVATDVGINSLSHGTRVVDNEVLDCSGTAFLGSRGAYYERNIAARCGGYAFDVQAPIGCTLRRNRAVDCASGGIRVSAYGVMCVADSNVVGRCGGPGFDIGEGSLRWNTSYLNQGAGFVLHHGSSNVTNNIAYGNLGVGLSYLGANAPILACNDWFANTGGATSGTPVGLTDLAVDPLFCDPGADDVRLSAGSPLLDASGCGVIGALGQGCLALAAVTPSSESLVPAFTASPNPSRGAVQFSWASSDRPDRVEVFDVTGARLWSSPITEGASVLQWPSIGREGTRLPAGIYYARLTSKGTSATARFVLFQ
jgi:hypothetical protein